MELFLLEALCGNLLHVLQPCNLLCYWKLQKALTLNAQTYLEGVFLLVEIEHCECDDSLVLHLLEPLKREHTIGVVEVVGELVLALASDRPDLSALGRLQQFADESRNRVVFEIIACQVLVRLLAFLELFNRAQICGERVFVTEDVSAVDFNAYFEDHGTIEIWLACAEAKANSLDECLLVVVHIFNLVEFMQFYIDSERLCIVVKKVYACIFCAFKQQVGVQILDAFRCD